MTAAVAALTAISTAATIQSGREQAKALETQAEFQSMQSEQEALRYRQEALDVMRDLEATNASVRARAAAGGIVPFSGSALAMQRFNERDAVRDTYILRENEIITLAGGTAQSAQYKAQSSYAQLGAYATAAGTITGGISTYKSLKT